MSPFEVVAAVITAFFGLGVVMGVLIVVALPRFRRRQGQPDYLDDDDDRPTLPGPHGDGAGPPAWPGPRA